MANAGSINTAFPNWAKVFDDLQQQTGVPDASSQDLGQNSWVFRDMFLDLGAIDALLTQHQQSLPSTIEIYADVLRIPANYVGNLQKMGMQILARRIEVGGTANFILDWRSDDVGAFALYAQEVLGNLSVSTVISQNDSDTPPTYPIGNFENGVLGIELSYDHGTVINRAPTAFDPALLQEDSSFQQSLATIFQYATLLFDYHGPTTLPNPSQQAIKQLIWIKTGTQGAPALAATFLQSTSLMANYQASLGVGTYVPDLSKNLYTDLSKAFVDAAQAFEQQYQRFSDKNEQIEARKEAATLMLANATDTADFSDQLIQQATDNLNNAQKAVDAAQTKLNSQTVTVKLASNDLKAGIKAWEYEQEKKAAFQIITGIFELGAGIAMMFVGDEAAVAGAAKAIGEIAEEGSKLAELIKKIAELTEKLLKIFEAAEKIAEAVKVIDESGEIGEKLKEIGAFDTNNDDDLSASEYWQQMQLEIHSQLKIALDNDIPGANEFQLQFDILVLYGQTLAANQQTAIQLSQELVRLNLQKVVSDNQEQRLSEYISKLSADELPNTEMMRMLFQRYLNVKRTLYISLFNYNKAYRYWALMDSSFKPSIVKSVAEQKLYIAGISQDLQNALTSFQGHKPQDFSSTICVFDDAELLNSLKQNNGATWGIDLRHPAFNGFDRIRASTVRIWLAGATTQHNDPILALVTNTGRYQDRYESKVFSFSSSVYQNVFSYVNPPQEIWDSWKASNWQVHPDLAPYVKEDGKISNELYIDYFEPTVFASWGIVLPKTDHDGQPLNQTLDLSGVTAIIMEFSGNQIANFSRSAR